MISVPQVGDCVGRYRLEEELGRGGMAVVFRALDPSLGREVAIKIMHAHLWGAADYAARFAREARAVAALRHPNIVEIYDYSQESGEGERTLPGFIVSELVRGPTLRQFLDLHGRPLPEVAALIGLKLASALGCAHQRGIIHRDLKPENVLIADGGRVLLTDFGIARVVEGTSATETGALIGSPAYMSPEQARGLHVDARADLFSLGVVLYQLCTGALPFPGKDPISTALRVIAGKYEPPLKLNPQIGDRLDRLLRGLLRVEPAQRPASAEALGEELREALAEVGIVDADAELQAYFAGPGEYNQKLVSRIIGAALAGAQQAAASSNVTTVLRLCDRVLAFDPDQPLALTLIKQQSRRRSWPWLLGVAALVIAVAGVAAMVHSRRSGPSSLVSATRPPSLDARQPPTQPPRPDAAILPDARAAATDLGLDHRRKARTLRRVAAIESDAAARLARPEAGPRLAPARLPVDAELAVKIGPFCDLSIDGRPVGRSPLPGAIKLAPGTHQVVCVHGPTGAVFRKQVRLAAGERQELSGLVVRTQVQVRLQLTRGDAVRAAGTTRSMGAGALLTLPAGRHRLELLRQGELINAEYVFILRDCTLVDQPRLECR